VSSQQVSENEGQDQRHNRVMEFLHQVTQHTQSSIIQMSKRLLLALKAPTVEKQR